MQRNGFKDIESFFLALSDTTRLQLLSIMADGETAVGYLSDRLDQSQPKISRHLAYLRGAGLVRTRRDGKWIFYSIDWPRDERARTILDRSIAWVREHGSTPESSYTAPIPSFARANEDFDEATSSFEPEELEVFLL